VVKLALTIDPAGATVNDVRVPVRGERVINQYGPASGPLNIGIRPGHHIITVRLAGMEDSTWEFDVTAGASESKRISLHKPSSGAATTVAGSPGKDSGVTNRPVPTGVYVGLAVTGALAIGGAVTGSMALGKRSEYNTQNDGLHTASAQDLKDKGATLNLVTDVLLGGAVVSAAITSIVFFSRPTTSSASSEPRTFRVGGVGATPDVVVGPNGAIAAVRGSF
jgi:hypothetical protein